MTASAKQNDTPSHDDLCERIEVDIGVGIQVSPCYCDYRKLEREGEMMTTTVRHCETCGQQMLPTDYWQRKATEIENAAYERAAMVCQEYAMDARRGIKRSQDGALDCAAAIRALKV